jgi:hypothetical protein
MTVGDGGYGRETWTRVIDVVPPDTKLKDVRAKQVSSYWPTDAGRDSVFALIRGGGTWRRCNAIDN